MATSGAASETEKEGTGARKSFGPRPQPNMKTKLLPSLIALAALALLAIYFPPGKFTWHRFFIDQSPLSEKLVYLLKAYVMPAGLSFAAVILFQIQMRFSVAGAPAYAVFPVSILGATAMLAAFRTMANGMGGIPGYVVGLAAAYTFMSRFAGLRPSGRYLLGMQTLKIVWRGDAAARAKPAPAAMLERRAS